MVCEVLWVTFHNLSVLVCKDKTLRDTPLYVTVNLLYIQAFKTRDTEKNLSFVSFRNAYFTGHCCFEHGNSSWASNNENDTQTAVSHPPFSTSLVWP